MTSCGGLRSGLACTHACVTGLLLAVSTPCRADVSPSCSSGPPLSAACRAWHSHISDLLDQHRKSNELDDAQFGEIVRLFYEAQAACTAEHFTEGLAVYEAIPVGRVERRPLR